MDESGTIAAMEPFIPDKHPIERINYASPALVNAMSEANRALARYDALLEQSPSSHLLLAPLARREAMLSARIEGSQSTLNEVFQFEEDENFAAVGEQRDDLNEIKNYVAALNLGGAELRDRPFSLNILKNLHRLLLGRGSVRGQTKTPGAFRSGQNWIGKIGADMAQASFVPPEPLLVPEFMEDWERFYLSTMPDALVQAAVMHAQFELIHPFDDGNGRLGRLLIPLFLYGKKVISRPNFYPSAYLERNRDAYMEALRQLGDKPGDWDGWVLFFLQAIAGQAEETSAKVKEITALYEQLKKRFIELTHSQFAVPMLDAIFERPIFRKAAIEKKLAATGSKPSGPTLHGLLGKLVEHEILTVMQQGKGRRGTLYALEPMMRVLTDDE